MINTPLQLQQCMYSIVINCYEQKLSRLDQTNTPANE